MGNCLMSYFICNDEIKSSCDFPQDTIDTALGIYEVIRVIDSIPLFLQEHMDRFFQSARLLKLEHDINNKQFTNSIKSLIDANRLTNGNIKVLLPLQVKSSQLFFWICSSHYPTVENYSQGVHLASLQASRPQPNAKASGLPVREKANEILKGSKLFEVVLIDESGYITECSRSNIFFIKNNKVFTSPVEHVLSGITRQKIILICQQLGLDFSETSLSIQELNKVDAVFITGSSTKVMPVKAINRIQFQPKHPVTLNIMKAYDALVAAYQGAFQWSKY